MRAGGLWTGRGRFLALVTLVSLLGPAAVSAALAGPSEGPPAAWKHGDTLARERARSERAASARLAQERVQGFLLDALARDRVSSGLVAPSWRDRERNLQARFQPTEALVQVGIRTMTFRQRVRTHLYSLVAQSLHSPALVPTGPLPRGEFAERGPAGEPESAYRNGLAAQQSTASMDAWERPAVWRRTEVELSSSASGQVQAGRVSFSSLSRALDERAIDAAEQSARGDSAVPTGKRTITRWAFESAYAVNPPLRLGFRFDLTGRIDKHARGLGRYLSDPLYLVGGNVHRRVYLLSLQESRR